MRTILVLVSIGIVALAGGIGPSEGQQHVFQLKEVPPMLTEELAVAKATETFQKEGYKLDQWQLTRAGNPPSEAPDGTPDQYFDRFSFRPTEGRVSFTNGKRSARCRFVWKVTGLFVSCSTACNTCGQQAA